MNKLNIDLWECTTCGSTTFCPHCKGEELMDINKHLVIDGDKNFDEDIYFEVKYDLQDAIDRIFVEYHSKYNTKSGDITPNQAIELEKLTMALALLIKDQIRQNL
tara:strand:- start:1029 stop:1343 length:315 start_codon:yes stop_codon:yes gene_type:complete